MDEGGHGERGDTAGHRQAPLCKAINGDFGVFAHGNGLSVRRLDTGVTLQCLLPSARSSVGSKSPLALSRIAPSRLALSCGQHVAIYNLDTDKLQLTLPGNGRTVCLLEWCQDEAESLAVATTDGCVSIYTLAGTSRPVCQIADKLSKGQKIGCIVLDRGVLAASYGARVVIWLLRRPKTPLRTIHVGQGSVLSLSWHPNVYGRLLTSSTDNIVRAWDFCEALASTQDGSEDSDDSDDDSFFGEMEGLRRTAFPITQIWLKEPVALAQWVGEHGTLVVAKSSAQVIFYSHGPIWESLETVWQLDLDECPDGLIVHDHLGAVSLTAVCGDHIETHLVPSAVMDSIGGSATSVQHSGATSGLAHGTNELFEGKVAAVQERAPTKLSTMSTVPIRSLRNEFGSFSKTSQQLQKGRKGSRPHADRSGTPSLQNDGSSITRSPLPAMTSSLELPKTRDEDDDFLMPFLSPSIPVRKPSPSTLPDIEDMLSLPPLQVGSFDSMLSTATQDSDSDDETFAGGLQDSGTFMPGGINVPLPRSCGASFSRNGTLVVFFPPKPNVDVQGQHDVAEAEEHIVDCATDHISRLFPAFGNLLIHNSKMAGIDTGGLSTGGTVPLEIGSKHSISMPPSSFQSQRSWAAKSSPTKSMPDGHNDNIRVVVNAYDLDSTLQSHRSVAEAYQISDHNNVSSTTCQHNAQAAQTAGSAATADAWYSLASVLMSEEPQDVFSGVTEDIGTLQNPRQTSSRSSGNPNHDQKHDKHLRWAQHPSGSAQTVKSILDLAERRSDVRFLAYASAVLMVAQRLEVNSTPAKQMKDQTFESLDRVYPSLATDPDVLQSRSIPLLRTDSSPADTMYQSPPKLRYQSRTPSQPSTPYLHSTSSSPPLSFPTLSRQSTKLSTGSGSASPEHHRSSFGATASATAKWYAQSITDKWASYGTSPPIRKTGTSPSMNELSSSLPLQSGSWSKSVSFASNTDPVHDSLQGENEFDDEYDYDSDRTIEDNSQPHTPRSRHNAVSVTMKNNGFFSGEALGSPHIQLLPTDLAAKASHWQQVFAEQLSCWGLDIQATEMRKISSSVDTVNTLPTVSRVTETITLSKEPKRRNAVCSICDCTIQQLAQLCPACLHANHPHCLKQFIEVMDDETYECPTGCGCACASLPFDAIEISAEEETAGRAVAKKPSFTDPIRWRARLEGESW